MKQPRICVAIAAEDVERAGEALQGVNSSSTDLVEIRLDYMETVTNLESLRTKTELPLIATNRWRREGGRFRGAEEERIDCLLKACDAGFDHIDIELAASEAIDRLKEKGVSLIISHHDFTGTPSIFRLKEILDEMIELRPDICKIVGTSLTDDDNLTYLNLIRGERARARIVSFGMGDRGIISRILSPIFGGEYTYASMGKGKATAQGQLSVEKLREIYRLMGMTR